MDAEWVRNIRDQCMDRNIPFFFKQWGGPRPKSVGRKLDGREWNQWPVTPHRSKQAKRTNVAMNGQEQRVNIEGRVEPLP